MIRNNPTHIESRRRIPRRHAPKGGIALVIGLCVLSLATVWTVDMLESASVYQSALRNLIEYEQALYQANAGVQHVMSQLDTDNTWRGSVSVGGYPANTTYSASAGRGGN